MFLSLLYREIKYFTNLHNKMYQFLLFFQPLVYLSLFYFIHQVRGDTISGKYVVASALISMWSYVLYSSGSSLISQKWNDTFMLITATPTLLFKIILSKTISNSIVALISMLLNFIYAKIIFQYSIGIQDYSLFFIAIMVLLFSLCVIGLLLAIIFVSFQNAYNYQNLVLTPFILISGIFVPVEYFPSILKYISYLLPMTWGVKSVYDAFTLSNDFYSTISISMGISLVYFLLAYYIIKKMETVIRKTGKWGII